MTGNKGEDRERLTDEHLVALAQGGDKDAFGDLARRYEPKLLRYASRLLSRSDLDPADVVQETLIKAYLNLKGFDVSRRFSPWIYRIAHNEIVNSVRKRAREFLDFYDFDSLFSVSSRQDVAEETDRAMLREELERCLAKLPSSYREPLVLFAYEGLSYGEISDILRLPSVTVGVRISRGRAKLKKLCRGRAEKH
jgi:RNA polymerase sigma-70 factor (ECF subfamily)